jgi:hypothetical protein
VADVLQLTGQLTLGASEVSDSSFPAGLLAVSLALAKGTKDAKVHAATVRALSSAGGYTSLRGVGSGEPVTKGTFLYLRTSAEMLVRFTTFDAGGDVLAVLPIFGVVILEFNEAKYLKLVEAQGSGTIELVVIGSE